MHQKKLFCIRCFGNRQKRLDASDHRRGERKGKTYKLFWKDRGKGGKWLSTDKKQFKIPWQHNGLQGKILAAVKTDQMAVICGKFFFAGGGDPSAAHGGQKQNMAVHGRKTKGQREIRINTSSAKKMKKIFR